MAKLQECLQIVEQSQFEKHEVGSSIVLDQIHQFLFQAIAERDQIRIELTETQKRLKKFLDEMNENIDTQKRQAEKVCDERLKENADKVNACTEVPVACLPSLWIRYGKRKNDAHSMN